ncbi:MAG: TlpA family protein disulfide reductase [Planctomycetia bacterium]|nr:TlpA family protein disulfide reductase [Planctomycetia bacterium]
MNHFLGLLAIIIAVAAAPGAEQMPDQPPGGQLQALVKEYQDSVDAFEKALQEVQGEAERNEFYRANAPQPERFYPRFMELAERHAKDAAAVDALIWVVSHSSNEPNDEATQRKARDALRRDYLASDRLPLVFRWVDNEFLQAVVEKSPHRTIRGWACYDLAERGLWRIRQVRRWRSENADWQQRKWKFKWIEQTQFAYFVTTDIDQATQESEETLERVVREFTDVPIEGRRNGKTAGELAKGHLHEIRHLAIGMPAPELSSVDLEGKAVQLSDLKGRVVVLDVWATWCGPCRVMIPHQRELVKRLDGKPFTLVSISVDEDRETVAEFLKNEAMPWTHWHNGTKGSIIADLNVWSYPTIYVLDAKGVIRSKDVRGKLLDQAVDALLKEVERQSQGK